MSFFRSVDIPISSPILYRLICSSRWCLYGDCSLRWSADLQVHGGCTASVGALPTYYSASASFKNVVQLLAATAAFYVGSFHTKNLKTDIYNRLAVVMIIIVYGSILQSSSDNSAALVGWHGRWFGRVRVVSTNSAAVQCWKKVAKMRAAPFFLNNSISVARKNAFFWESPQYGVFKVFVGD
jgi:hypothetical protein